MSIYAVREEIPKTIQRVEKVDLVLRLGLPIPLQDLVYGGLGHSQLGGDVPLGVAGFRELHHLRGYPVGRPVAGTTTERLPPGLRRGDARLHPLRSEEHTSELQSRQYLVCRLLL